MPDLVLYDGVCGLCNRANRFILRRDHRGHFRFAALQGELAGQLLQRHGRPKGELDTAYVVAGWGTPDERLLWKGRAVLHVLRQLGGIWALAALAALLPNCVLDWLYENVARRRYRWFGRVDACPVPAPEHKARFVDPT